MAPMAARTVGVTDHDEDEGLAVLRRRERGWPPSVSGPRWRRPHRRGRNVRAARWLRTTSKKSVTAGDGTGSRMRAVDWAGGWHPLPWAMHGIRSGAPHGGDGNWAEREKEDTVADGAASIAEILKGIIGKPTGRSTSGRRAGAGEPLRRRGGEHEPDLP